MTTTIAPSAGLDPATLAAIRESLAAAQRGSIADACVIAERALASGGDPGALNAMLGMLRGQAGEHDAAIRHLEIAYRAKPGDPRIATNLASALLAAGDHAKALEVAGPALAFADPTLQLARIRGHAAQVLGNANVAIQAYEHVVTAAPADWESWNNLGNARLMLSDFEGGTADLRRSAELNPEELLIQLNLAKALRQSGQFDEAEQILRAAADKYARDVQPLIDLHDLLKIMGRSDEEVLQVLERAIERDPRNVELLLGLARQHALLLQMDGAERAYRSVIALDPVNSEAFVGLATVYEHSRPDAIEGLVAEAGGQPLDQGTHQLLQAFADRRAKRYAEGLTALETVPRELAPARREDLMGQCHAGLGNHDAAFAAFSEMNDIQAEDPSQPLLRSADLRRRIQSQLDRTTSEWFGGWNAPPVKPARSSPLFLVGFPRSGTTLLDTMLMGHPQIEVMEERPVVTRTEERFGGFEALAGLDEAQVRQAQEDYFAIASGYADLGRGALLVDKSPLHLNQVPIIHRLFPDARYILALRHPADVVLSCFVSNFRLNPSMSNFVRLDTAAEFYDLTFRNWERARDVFGLNVHSIMYEKLVADPEAELRRLAGEMEIEWRDEMLDHIKTAAARGVIATASYAQVTEPIYSRSVGRWENYRKHLEPVLPVLAPWAEKFGYRT